MSVRIAELGRQVFADWRFAYAIVPLGLVAIAVTLQPRDKTMTDAEIEAVAAKIVAEVGKRTGGVLRA